MKLSEYFSVNSHFTRSINLEKDLNNANIAKNYVWTESNRLLVNRINYEISDTNKTSSFSLTGPFGSGKSAFVLQLMQLLGISGKAHQKSALNNFISGHKDSENLSNEAIKNNPKPFVISVTGSQMPIKQAIIFSIIKTLQDTKIRAPHGLQKAVKDNSFGELNIVDIITKISKSLKDNGYGSLILLIDEFGKLLEYVAMHPSKSDIYVLQQLAEIRRSEIDTNFIFFSILHQSFDGYARHLSKESQNEWAKIQGRFYNLNIAEKPIELVPLIASAINSKKELPVSITELLNKNNRLYKALPFAKDWLSSDFENLAKSLYPLNLNSAFILPFLSKLIGQNTRSTFTFLASYEPYSFAKFLEREYDASTPEITLDRIFDYFDKATEKTANNKYARRWQEVDISLNRISEEFIIERKILKTIGILNIIQQPRLFPASSKFVIASLINSYKKIQIENGIKKLVDDKIIVFRKFSNEYRIWEGSDFDIEAAIEKRKEDIYNGKELVPYLEKLCPLQNIIAKKHYSDKGTLRFFNMKFHDIGFLELLTTDEYVKDFKLRAEGSVLLISTFDMEEYDKALSLVNKFTNKKDLIFIIAKPNPLLSDALEDYVSLLDIASTETILVNDTVAQKEIKDRVFEAEELIVKLVNKSFFGFNSNFNIYRKGIAIPCNSNRIFHRELSNAFDDIYTKAPTIKNELLNRFVISGTISHARNQICKAINKNNGKEDLGLTGFASETTIFKLIFKNTGMYSKKNGNWAFSKPSDTSWNKTWSDLNKYIADQQGNDIKLQDLLDHFAMPPYGIRSNVMIMTVIALLHTPDNGITLYDEGTYTPSLDDITLELMCKRPHLFSIRKIGGETNTKLIIKTLAKELIGKNNFFDRDLFFAVVRDIYRRIRKLPSHVNQTKKIPSNYLEVRNLILKANSPEELIFKSIPSALNIDISKLSNGDSKSINDYAYNIKACLDYLDNYMVNVVLKDCYKSIVDVFKINEKNSITNLRKHLCRQSNNISNIANDVVLKNFVLKCLNTDYKDAKWFESLLGAISSRPLNIWSDIDRSNFENKTRLLFKEFNNCKILLAERANISELSDNSNNFSRISISDIHGLSTDLFFEDFELDNNNVELIYKNIKENIKDAERESITAALFKLLKEYSTDRIGNLNG